MQTRIEKMLRRIYSIFMNQKNYLCVQMRRIPLFRLLLRYIKILRFLAAKDDAESPSKQKRLLAVYDLSVQPYSIGDLIVFLEGSLLFSSLRGADKIDLCFISDRERPCVEPKFNKTINSNNRLYYLLRLMPLVQINERIGSIFVFDSYQGLRQFVSNNMDKYFLWPTIEQLENREYNYYDIFYKLHEYYMKHKAIPQFSFNKTLTEWSELFFQKNVFPDLPVTINVRNNREYDHHRNSDIGALVDFFQYCNNKYAVKFIIICSYSEIDDRLRMCPNVIIAKDFNTGVEHDLAIIYHSAFHLGVSSGIGAVSVVGNKPYSFFKSDMLINLNSYKGALIHESDGSLRFSFASRLQRFLAEKDSQEMLIKEFERIWLSRDWSKWGNSNKDDIGEDITLTWLG